MVRAGELLAVCGLELYCWPFDEQSNAAARSAAHSSRKSVREGCKGSSNRFGGLRDIQGSGTAPGYSGVQEDFVQVHKTLPSLSPQVLSLQT